MHHCSHWIWLAAVAACVTGCASGGGGSGATSQSSSTSTLSTAPSVTSYVRTEVPYSTPVLQVVVDPLVNTASPGYKWAVSDTFAASIEDSSAQDLIIAGRMTQSTPVAEWGDFKLSMLGWRNSRLVDVTSDWFPNNTNIILGTEPSVKFADFFKTGRNDMFVSTSTDMQHYGPTYFFRNTGTSFERQVLTTANIWSHDSAIGDLDGDGYTDIAIIDYGPNTTLAFNNKVSGFNVYTQNPDLTQLYTGSSVAIGNFMQDSSGRSQLIVTDTPGGPGSNPTKMYSWNIDASNKLSFTEISTLPTPRFELPKWSGHGFTGSHGVRVVTYDFNTDGIPDTLIFSQPGVTTSYNKYSEIQFLQNLGQGSFTDVTDTILIGYNTNTRVCYNPKFLDLNGDGREDILVSGADSTGANNSTQFLLKSSDGKYVAAYQNIMTDFTTQVNSIHGTDNVANTVNMLQAPDGKLYLVSAVSFLNTAGDRQLAVYMSELGTQSITTAKSAVDLLLAKWPYMTVPQANAILAQTSASYLGGQVIDWEALWRPSGALTLSTTNGIKALSGSISGINLGSTSVIVQDDLQRSFTMNLQSMHQESVNAFAHSLSLTNVNQINSHTEYLINGAVADLGWVRIGSNMSPDTGATNTMQYTLGLPKIYNNQHWSVGMQYTKLNTNPWINFHGAWGTVTGSSTVDTVISYQQPNFSTQFGLMHTRTSIDPGLVTKVNAITAAWAETGYHKEFDSGNSLDIYAGVKPMILAGSVQAKIPTDIDNAGKILYTDKTLYIQDTITGYVRGSYKWQFSKQSQLQVSGMRMTNGQYQVINELKWRF